jgi:hypothetical protein
MVTLWATFYLSMFKCRFFRGGFVPLLSLLFLLELNAGIFCLPQDVIYTQLVFYLNDIINCLRQN